MRYSELIEKLSEIKARNDEMEKGHKVLGDDPKVYMSLGPSCMSLSLEVQNVGTVMGSIDGFFLGAEIDLPPELYQEWFDLKEKILKHRSAGKIGQPLYPSREAYLAASLEDSVDEDFDLPPRSTMKINRG